MSDLIGTVESAATARAMKGFAELMTQVCRLYTGGESSSVSESEGYELAESVLYVLGLTEDTVPQTIALLSSEDVVAVWTRKRHELEARIPGVMQLWQRVVATMPAIHNIALRDTLESIGNLPRSYDTYFAAHEVPCDIDYPLSNPISERVRGLDYIESWLEQLLREARFLAQFDTDELVASLDAWCPDYRGLLINLYDPIYAAWRNGEIAMARPSSSVESDVG